MPRTIRFTISRDGTVESEYTGFPGDECLNEAEALNGLLKKYGLKTGARKVTMKTPDQIEQELGLDEATKPKERAKVGHED